MARRAALLALLALLPLAGCALTSKQEPLAVRYYSAASTQERESEEQKDRRLDAELLLRLRGVDAAVHLREEIVTRVQQGEYRLAEGHRWTERPAAYVERALSWALFDVKGLTRSLAADAPTLEVTLLAFEDVEDAAYLHQHRLARGVALSLRLLLYDGRSQRVLLERTLAHVGPAHHEGPEDERRYQAVALALDAALTKLAARAADLVVPALRAHAARPGAGR